MILNLLYRYWEMGVGLLFGLHVVFARLCVGRLRQGRGGYGAFAVVNLIFFSLVSVIWTEAGVVALPVYFGWMLAHFFLMRARIRQPSFPWLLVVWPLGLLVFVQNSTWILGSLLSTELGRTLTSNRAPLFMFTGLSFVAFRTSRLVLDLRRRPKEPLPTLAQYFSYVFFLPIMQVGPITRFHTFVDLYTPTRTELGWSCVRIVFGLAKYSFVGLMLNQLTYKGLFLDGYAHGWGVLCLSSVAYMFYLYANFSGYCDVAIGIGGLIGVKIDENFNDPFRSRNLQEFWTKYHMTLGAYLRDMLFTPLSTVLLRKLPDRMHVLGMAGASVFVFLVMGLWHGQTWPMLVYGLLCGVGVAATMLYDRWLRDRLSREQMRAYRAHRGIRAVAVVATVVYMSGALFFMANPARDIETSVRVLQGGPSVAHFPPILASRAEIDRKKQEREARRVRTIGR